MSDNEVRMTARLPAELHERLKQAAERDHRSMHQQMLAYLERGLNADEAKARKEQRSR